MSWRLAETNSDAAGKAAQGLLIYRVVRMICIDFLRSLQIEILEASLPPATSSSQNMQRGLQIIKHSDVVATSMINVRLLPVLGQSFRMFVSC